GTTKAGQAALTQTKAGSVVQSGHHITTKIKKALLDGNFNPTFRVHVTANNVVNGVITEGAELTADVTVGVDYLNSTDAVNVVSPNVLLLSTLNELSNGDFHRARNTGASRSWTVGIGGGFIPAVPFPGGSTGTGLDFDVTNHWVHWYAFVPGPTQKLGDPGLSTAGMAININPGDNKTVGLRMWSLNGPHTLSFNCILRTDTGINVVLVPFSVALTSQAQLVQVSIAVPTGSPFPGANAIFLSLTSADGLITALNDVIIDGI